LEVDVHYKIQDIYFSSFADIELNTNAVHKTASGKTYRVVLNSVNLFVKCVLKCITNCSRISLEPIQSPLQLVPGNLSPGMKRQRREANKPPPSSTEVKKTWIYIPTPPYAFMA
jgi:hypothetical protein